MNDDTVAPLPTSPPTSLPGAPQRPEGAAIPDLRFAVLDAGAEPYAAVPTLRITLAVENRRDMPVQSILLTSQLRIDVARRAYDHKTQSRLVELFGEPERWGETVRTLYWTHATNVVPPFGRDTRVALLLPCTYDFELAVAKYFHAVDEGEIPVEILFSGSIFFTDALGLLRTVRIGTDAEATYRLPARLWTEIMDHYFPNGAWLRVRRDTFDHLYAYRARYAIPTWEQTLETLLAAPGSVDRSMEGA